MPVKGAFGRRMGIPLQKIEQKGCFWWEIRNLFYLAHYFGQKSWAARCQEGGKMGAKLIIGGDWSTKMIKIDRKVLTSYDYH